MENFYQFFILSSIHENIGFNSNILETGLINIIGLLIILIYTGQDFLGSLLKERKKKIITNIETAENRLIDAQSRFEEAEKKLKLINTIIAQIRDDGLSTKKLSLKFEAAKIKKELDLAFSRGLASFKSKEREVFTEVKEQIILATLQQTLTQLKEIYKQKNSAKALINKTINKLEGDLL